MHIAASLMTVMARPCACACTVVVRSPRGDGGPSLGDRPPGGGGGPSSLGCGTTRGGGFTHDLPCYPENDSCVPHLGLSWDAFSRAGWAGTILMWPRQCPQKKHYDKWPIVLLSI